MTISNTITIYLQPADATQTFPVMENLSIFKTFESILNTFATNLDPLSKALKLEGRSMMHFVAKEMEHLAGVYKDTSDEKVREFEVIKALKETITKIEVLKKVLKNPLGPSLFVEPWLVENSVTWEKTTLEEYQLLSSTFTQNKVLAEPHKFAMEVLAWIDKCPKQLKHSELLLQGETPQLQQALMLPQEVQNYIRYNEFNQLITLTKGNSEKEAKIKEQDLKNLELFKMVETLSEMNIEGLIQYEERLDMIQKSHLLQISEIDRMLEGSRTRETNTVKVCHEKNMITEEMLLKTRSELVETYNKLEQQRAYSNQLWSIIRNCQAEIQDLQNKDDGCSIQ